MAFGDVDDAEFQAFCKKVGSKAKGHALKSAVAKNLVKVANYSVRELKSNTPVDTGALRNDWSYENMTIGGSSFSFTVINSMEYARYVEYGHRTRGGGGWVEGQFFMKRTIPSIQSYLNEAAKPIIQDILEGLFS